MTSELQVFVTRHELLTQQLLRLEAGELSAGESALATADSIIQALPSERQACQAVAEKLLQVLQAVRNQRLAATPDLCAALVLAADALGQGVMAEDPGSGDEFLLTAEAELQRSQTAAVIETPLPSTASHLADWPSPGGPFAADLLAEFHTEATETLHEAEAGLLELESAEHNHEAVGRLFRAIHSLKGAAGYVGLRQVHALCHELEHLLSAARIGRISFTTGASDFAFRGVDYLKAMIAATTTSGEVPQNIREFVVALRVLVGHTGSIKANPKDGLEAAYQDAIKQHRLALADALRAVASGDFTDGRLDQLSRSVDGLCRANVVTGRSTETLESAELRPILARLKAARSEFAELLLQAVNAVPIPQDETVQFVPSVVAEQPAPASITSPSPGSGPIVTRPPSPPESPASPENPATVASSKPNATAKSMRVDQRKLDEYLNISGELVIARNALMHSSRQVPKSQVSTTMKDAVEKVCRLIGDLQNNAMGMRMVPVGTVFQRVPRLVRDIAKTLDKQIEVFLSGEETELDKQVAEALSDPLVHLIRNAADHGIEPKTERLTAGKSPIGTLTLTALREGNAIHIDIEDDGGGIDDNRLRAKAVATKLLTEEQAAALSHDQALELIFAPGLSTAKVVSDLSGRGVGMDVVRSNIAALGGTVSVRSVRGRGTRIRLTLPLTLAVTTVVMVEAGGNVYGLPIEAVRETIKVAEEDQKPLGGGRAIALRGDLIPLMPLPKLMGQPAASPIGERVVVLEQGRTRLGLQVNHLIGQQEVVIKPVPPSLGSVAGIGGTTIDGDGSIVLILEPSCLLRLACSQPF